MRSIDFTNEQTQSRKEKTMKITGNEEIFKQLPTGPTGKSGKPAKGVFGALLRDAVKTDKGSSGKNHPLREPSSIKGVSFNPLFDARSISIPDRVANFLNLLDSYRDMLADSGVSLREIGPVMQKLTAEKNNLQKVLGELPEGDELREILNQVLVAASLEEIRFNKGDYNPA